MPRELIAIVTCHAPKYRERANAVRATWAQHAAACGYDLKFFLGQPPNGGTPGSDEIYLDVEDGYNNMPAKVRAVCKWAAAEGYDYIFKTDDDVYVNMMALRLAPHAPHDYVGRFRGPSGNYPADYASGYGYWLSTRAMRIVAESALTNDWAEDRWVANALAIAGVAGYTDEVHYRACYPPTTPELVFNGQLRTAAAFCEYPPALMHRMYTMHKATRLKSGPRVILKQVPLPGAPVAPPPKEPETIIIKPTAYDLSKLCVLVKTFLRDGYLFDCVAGLQANFPDVRMVIIDDGKPSPKKDGLYARLRAEGHCCEYMPYDSGFGEKSNYAIQFYDRPYVLIASDDFDFADIDSRYGVEQMVKVLDGEPALSVASGRVDNNPYEAFLYVDGDTVTEKAVKRTDGEWRKTKTGEDYKLVDLTVNYSVIRVAVLGSNPGQVRWDGGEVKIGGGEHGAFYLDLKDEGYKVAHVPGVNISTMRYNPAKQDPIYDEMRGRARQPGRICLRRRGFKRWILQDGTVELV